MDEDFDPSAGSLEIMVRQQAREQTDAELIAARAEEARMHADAARLALAHLAEPAVRVIAARLAGAPAEGGQGALKAGTFPLDDEGRPVTREREDTAWEVLARIGVPRLRATAVAASIAAQTHAPAPLAPGWVDPALDGADDGREEDAKELDPASVDAQIVAFLEGARAQRDLS